MLGVAVVEDPLAFRKLGEVQVGAEIHLEERGSLVAEGDALGVGADAGATSLAVAAKSTTRGCKPKPQKIPPTAKRPAAEAQESDFPENDAW